MLLKDDIIVCIMTEVLNLLNMYDNTLQCIAPGTGFVSYVEILRDLNWMDSSSLYVMNVVVLFISNYRFRLG